jgi:hypothetical protein
VCGVFGWLQAWKLNWLLWLHFVDVQVTLPSGAAGLIHLAVMVLCMCMFPWLPHTLTQQWGL